MPCFDIKDIDPHYLLTYVTQRNFYTHFGMIADGGRKARRVGPEDMLSFPIVCPHLAEQQKIAEILSTQDKLIELNQRKIEELKKLKKYYLSKMFPQNGSNVPEIRFKGFTEPWEQRRLGECFDERTERSADGELIAVTINLGVVKASELNRHDNSSDDKSNYKVVRKNDIAYNSMRMWQGASGYSLYDGILSPAYTVAIPMENINSIFFSYLFKQTDMIHEFQINSQGLTSDTWNLKFPSFSLIKVKVPKIEEQQQIGAYFKNLDRIITLHRSKLKELKKQKKSLIQLLLTGIVRVKT
ncbi:MAG TPA: restriction endonuclease subunit S [Ruminococcus sp.]|nr:restriction endonuclease subunit S [Ruminococcus sp.]